MLHVGQCQLRISSIVELSVNKDKFSVFLSDIVRQSRCVASTTTTTTVTTRSRGLYTVRYGCCFYCRLLLLHDCSWRCYRNTTDIYVCPPYRSLSLWNLLHTTPIHNYEGGTAYEKHDDDDDDDDNKPTETWWPATLALRYTYNQRSRMINKHSVEDPT